MLECEIVQCSTELVQKVQEDINNGYCLVIIIKECCINKDLCILFGFDYFDESISIYLWCHLLMLVIGTSSVMLMDSTK